MLWKIISARESLTKEHKENKANHKALNITAFFMVPTSRREQNQTTINYV
jgi:hypothetical protein